MNQCNFWVFFQWEEETGNEIFVTQQMILRIWMKARGLSELGVFLQVTCLVNKLEPKSAIPTGLTPQTYTKEGTDCRKTLHQLPSSQRESATLMRIPLILTLQAQNTCSFVASVRRWSHFGSSAFAQSVSPDTKHGSENGAEAMLRPLWCLLCALRAQTPHQTMWFTCTRLWRGLHPVAHCQRPAHPCTGYHHPRVYPRDVGE